MARNILLIRITTDTIRRQDLLRYVMRVSDVMLRLTVCSRLFFAASGTTAWLLRSAAGPATASGQGAERLI